FDDVTPALKQWKSKDVKIYIYSSGSVSAQKLLFGNSKCGDLLQYINGHFDTIIGAKMESNSYEKIAEEMKLKPSSILFVTDVIGEAKAA
ncbi:HAD-IA family hydrolase, partial [Salmonella enterica]|uniref:HAD-IA family hydrolase n=1 Tax=Salmonella enterica TaxID=28901 RepID=UPI0032971F8E